MPILIPTQPLTSEPLVFLRRALLPLVIASLAGCGSGAAVDVQASSAPPRIDRELAACRTSMAGGQPPAVADDAALRGLCFEAFAVVHDATTRTPKVVLEAIDRASLSAAQAVPRVDHFYEEARLPAAERSTLADYRGSGYDRGHLAPAADMPTVGGSAQSFSLANMVPQVPSHNSGAWSRVERDTRSYAMRAPGVVYVATGAVFDASPDGIGPGQRVRVPAVLFKLVHDATTGRSWAHWQQNAAGTASGAPISHTDLVQRLGYDPMPGVAHLN